jgi:hypothetical protein
MTMWILLNEGWMLGAIYLVGATAFGVFAICFRAGRGAAVSFAMLFATMSGLAVWFQQWLN